jgi:hypothetical protein
MTIQTMNELRKFFRNIEMKDETLLAILSPTISATFIREKNSVQGFLKGVQQHHESYWLQSNQIFKLFKLVDSRH